MDNPNHEETPFMKSVGETEEAMTDPAKGVYVTQLPTMKQTSQAKQAAELFSRPEIRTEFSKTHEPNAVFRGRVVEIHEFVSNGRRIINLSYLPVGVKVPFAVGFQSKQGSSLFEMVDSLPKDYRGEIVVTNNERGGVGSVQMADLKS